MNTIKTAILMAVNTHEIPFTQDDKEELINLAQACNIEVQGFILQNLDRINSDTYVGPGKINEVITMAEDLDVDYIITNHDVSARVIRNLDKLTNAIVLDRNMLILEIFSARAKSKSAQLQVEIAKINYELPRLVGSSDHLSRQAGSTGGGLANRGAGETKLELERRNLNKLLSNYKAELKALNTQQEIQKRAREKSNIFRVSLVGYTNAGKSTIMNHILKLSDNEGSVFAKDMLFATLDTYTRLVDYQDVPNFLLSDTIGFINNLHHSLIEAFKSTLSEVSESDLLLHVIDVSNPNHLKQKQITEDTLKEIKADHIPMIEIYNKSDLATNPNEYPNSITISALKQDDIEYLLEIIDRRITQDYVDLTLHIPYEDGKLQDEVFSHKHSKIIEEDTTGYLIKTKVSSVDAKKLRKYSKYLH